MGSKRNKLALNKFLSPLDILPYNKEAIRHYAKLCQELQPTGNIISSPDMPIATHSLVLDAVLVTNNTLGFERIVSLTY